MGVPLSLNHKTILESECPNSREVQQVKNMGEQWIDECNHYLQQVKAALALENPDRLDLVTAMQRAILAINHSILGWLQYINNPDIMSRFERTELHEISDSLNKFAESFIEHDIEVTRKGVERGLKEIKQEQEEERQPFYV
jgi:hypothetical protein